MVLSRERRYIEPKSPVGTVAELFAGVGGFRIGLAAAGWKTVFSNQWEPATKAQHASEVYVNRFGALNHSSVDISTVQKIPTNFDLLVGGFPCQDYSVAKSKNSATGLKGKKGVLWWEILRLVNKHKPKFIFLENVDRLIKSPSSQRGRDFAVMLTTLGNEGYSVEWRVVNSADYGFPQRRIRVFIVAKKIRGSAKIVDFSDYMLKTGTLACALPITPGSGQVSSFEISKDPQRVSSDFNKLGTNSPFHNSGVYLNGHVYTMKTQAVYNGPFAKLGDVLEDEKDVPEEFWIDSKAIDSWKYLKGAKSEDRTHKESGFAYKYSEGSMAFPDSLEKPSRTILTGEGGKTPSRFKHVIKIGRRYRRLTPLELERLAGFPDNWTQLDATITDGRRAFFVGNALVVGIVELIGRQLAKEHKLALAEAGTRVPPKRMRKN
jgi:DNA (cytosine-5)-methyltransferase 1